MFKKFTDKTKIMFQKLKKVKHIEIIVAVIAVLIMVLIYFVSFQTGGSDKKKTDVATNAESVTAELENKVSDILSSIQGAGKVKVLITFSSTVEKIYYTTESTTTNKTINGSGSTTEMETSTSTVVKDGDNEPVVVKELLPEVLGVVVVSEGAKNISTKLALIKAVQTVLGIKADIIEVFAMQ